MESPSVLVAPAATGTASTSIMSNSPCHSSPKNQQTQPKQQQVQPISQQNIDSALCAGMKDPRERAALFRLEVCYQDFCKSSSSWMDVGGAYNRCIVLGPATPTESQQDSTNNTTNDPIGSQSQPTSQLPPPQPTQQSMMMLGHQTSFHRLLVHRLADRFGIRRESQSPNTIRLFKGPHTQIPAVLLQDLEPALYYPESDATLKPNNHQDASLLVPSDKPSSSSSKKKIIMKKRGSAKKPAEQRQRDYQANSRASSSSEQLLEARERAYAEARARIFNEDAAGNTTTNPEDENDVTQDMAQMSLQEGANSTTNAAPASSTSQDDKTSSPASLSSQQQQGDVDRKAVYRNRAEEAADPDFRRGRIRTAMPNAYPYLPQQPTPPFPPPPQHHHHQQQQQQLAGMHSTTAATAYKTAGQTSKRPTAATTTPPTLMASAPVFVPGIPSPTYNHHKSMPQPSAWGNGAPASVMRHNASTRYNGHPGQPTAATWYAQQHQQQQSPRGMVYPAATANNTSSQGALHKVTQSPSKPITAVTTNTAQGANGGNVAPAVRSS